MKKFNIHLAVTRIINFNCPKKNIMELLIQYLSIPQIPETKKVFLLGNIVHKIFQLVLKYRISQIEYLYFSKYKEKKNIESIIYEVFEDVFSAFQEIYEFKFSNKDTEYSRKTLESVFNSIFSILKELSKLSSKLLEIQENKIISYVIDDELEVRYEYPKYNVIISGKIDLITYNQKLNKVSLIELKTGMEYDDHLSQILIYGEILKSKYDDLEIQLEIWYPKLKKIEIISKNNLSGEVFKQLSNSIEKTELILKKKEFLEELRRIKSSIKCESLFCKLCDEYEKTIQKKLKNVDIQPLDSFF